MHDIATDAELEELRKGLAGVTPGPWIRSGVRRAYPERAKATWIGPDEGQIIGVMFSDLTPEEYQASMADAKWVFLAQPGAILRLLNLIDQERARIRELEKRYEDWHPVAEAPHQQLIEQGALFAFLLPDEYEATEIIMTGAWIERPADALAWCVINRPDPRAALASSKEGGSRCR